MGKRGLDRFTDELELKYSNGNKRARCSEICLSKDGAKFWKEDSLKIKPYVYVKPLEESLAIQAYKEGNTINLADYSETSSFAVAILSSKKPYVYVKPLEESLAIQAYKEGNTINLADYSETSSFAVAILSSKKPTNQSIVICRKAVRELQFLNYLEKLGWKSDIITEYCRTSQTDLNTLMKELKVLYLSLKECNVNVDKIIEQCSKDQRNVKLFFEYLTKYLQSISTRKPVIVLERIDQKLNLSQNALKRKMQEILIPDQNKVGKVNIVDDTTYQEVKKSNRKKSCTRIREDLSVNKPFVAPYNFQQDKSSLTPGGKRLGKSLDSLGEVESCTEKEELPIRSKVSERPVDNYYQSSILKPDERNKQIPRRKLTPQDAPEDTNYDAETYTIESTDSLKESETKINAGIEENVLSKSNEQVSTVSSRLSKRDTRKRKVIEKNWNLQSKSKSTSTGKPIVIPTNDSSSIEEETVNELGDSSRNDERMDASTKKREPLISSKKVYRKRNDLRKRSTRGTKGIESDNNNGMADAKCTLPVKEKISKNSLAVDCTVNDGKQSESTIDKDNSTEDCGKNGVNTDKQDLKEIETEDSFILTENDSSIQKLEDSLKQTQVRKETLQIENVSLINSEECVRFDAGNENKDDAASDKDMDSGSRDSTGILKSGTENKNLVNKFQASKDGENEMNQSIDIKSDKNTNVLRDSLESVLEERTNTNDTKETIDTTDVDEVRLSENKSLRHTRNRKKQESLIKNDSKNKNEINKIAKGLKQMELSSDEVSSTSRYNEESKRFHLGGQVLEECAASLSNIVSSQEVDKSTNLIKGIDIVLKPVTVRLDLLTSYIDKHGKRIDMTGREKFFKAPDHSKADECTESANKYKEAKDLQEEKIHFENSEISQHNPESKSANLGEQVLEECAASLSNIVSSQDVDMSTNSTKETDISPKHVTVKSNSLTSYLDDHGKDIEMTGREMFSKAPDLSKTDEFIESAIKYKEIKDLQEKIINFEISETLQHNEENKSSNLGEQILEECSANLSKNSDEESESANQYKETNGLQEKMMNLENSEILQNNAGSKSSHLPEQILEECSDSLSRKSDECTESAKLYKEIKGLQEKIINFEISETSQHNAESKSSNLEEQILEECSASLSTKSDDCNESANKYKETKDLEEKMINFEYSEKTKSDDKKQHGDVEITNALPISHQSQCEKTIEKASYSFNSPLSFQNFSTGSNKNIRDFDAKKELESNKEDIIVKDSSSKRIEINKRSTVVKKRSFDIESLIAIDEPKEQCNLIGEKQFERNSAEARYFSTMESTDSLRASTPNEKHVPISQHEIRSVEEQTTNKVSPRKEENEVAVVAKKREQLISSDSAESSQLRNREETKEVERNITSTLDLDSKSEHSTAGKEITIPNNDTCCIDEEVASESGDSSRKDAIMQAGNKNLEPLISNDSVESSRLRKRATRKTKDVEKNTMSTLNLDSKSEPTPAGKQITITSNDFCSIEKEKLVSESGDSIDSLRASTPNEKHVPISQHEIRSVEEQTTNKVSPRKEENEVAVVAKKREQLISSDSAESSQLRNREETKEVERNITSTLDLDSKSEHSTAGKEITIPNNDTCCIDEEVASESGDSSRKDAIMQAGNKNLEPLISNDSVESSRLRKRATRKTKDVEKNTMSTLNLDSKSEPTPAGKQITITSNDFCSIEKEKLVSESGDSIDSLRASTPNEKHVPISQHEIRSVEEQTTNKVSPRKEENEVAVVAKKREQLISSDSAESSQLRNREETKEVERNITSTLDLDSKSEHSTAGKEITIPNNDTCCIDEEVASESGDSSRKDAIMQAGNKNLEPLISNDSVESSRLRKRATRKTKDVEKNTMSTLNLDSKSEPTPAGKQITITSNDFCSIEKEKLVSESGDSIDSLRASTPNEKHVPISQHEIRSVEEQTTNKVSPRKEENEVAVVAKKREQLISSDSAESSQLRNREETKEVERNITSTLDLDSKSEHSTAGKEITIPNNDTCCIDEEVASESGDSSRKDAIMQAGNKNLEPLISNDSVESSRLRKRATRKTKDVEKNTMSTLNLDSKSEPTPAGKQITITSNDFCSIEKEKLVSESGDSIDSLRASTPNEKHVPISQHEIRSVEEQTTNKVSPRKEENEVAVVAKKREQLISSDSAESSQLRNREETKEVERNITSTLDLDSKSEHSTAGKEITIPNNDTCCIDEEVASESGDSSRKDAIMQAGNKNLEPLISNDSVESSRLRKRATRKTKDVEKNTMSTLNLDSKSEPTPAGKQITITSNDFCSIEKEKLVSESGDSIDSLRASTPNEKHVPISQHEIRSVEEQTTNKVSPRKEENEVAVVAKKREQLISSDSAESSQLRNREETKEVERNITSTLDLDSKSEHSTTGKEITIPNNDTCCIDEEVASESGDSSRKDAIMQAGNKNLEPLISNDSVESSRLRKRATRKTKDVEKNTMSTLNLDSKSEPTPAGKQITITSNDFCSIEKEKLVSESGDSPRKDQILEACPNEREPLIISDSVEKSQLRKRATRKTKAVDKSIASTLNLESQSEPNQAENQITILTNDTCLVEEELVSKWEYPYKNDEIIDINTKKPEPLIHSDSVKSSRFRKWATRKRNELQRYIESFESMFNGNIDSKSEPTPAGKQITIPTDDSCAVEEEQVSESCNSFVIDEIMEVDNKKRDPLISTNSTESSRLRKRTTRKTKGVDKNITSTLNLDSKSEQTSAGKQITIPSNDFSSNEEEKLVSESGDHSRKDEIMDVSTKKQEPLMPSDSVESSRLRKRATRKTKNVEKNITSLSNLEPKSQQAQAGKQITIPSSDSSFIEEEQLVSELGDPHKNDVIMGVSKKKLEPLIPSNSVESSRLRKRASRKTKDAERNITSTLNLDPKSEPTPAGKRITVPTNDSCPIEGELVSESGDSSRKDQIMEVGTKEQELLISSDRAENSQLRKRVTRKTKSADRNIMPTLNLEPKSQPTEAGKQITVPTNDSCSIEEELVSKSGDLSRNEIMEADTNEREPLISSDRVECRRLRKRATRKTKSVEEIITSTLNMESKGEPTPARKQIAVATNDTCSTEEELVSESGDPSRKDEPMEVGTKEQELSVSVRKQAEENLKRSKEKESSDDEISQIWCFSTKDTERRSFEDIDPEMFSVDSQMLSSLYLRLESMDLNKNPVEKSTPCPDFKANGNSILCPYDTFQDADFRGLRKRSTRGTKVFGSENDNSTALSLNSDRTRKQPEREKVLDITPDIDVNLGDDISESTKLDENNGEKSPNLSNNTKSDINDEFKRRLVVDVSASVKTEFERINQGLGILIEDGMTLQINERKDKQLVYRVSRNQTQSTTEVDKSKSSKRNSNNLDISRKGENGAIRDLRNSEEERTKDDESERLKRDKSGVKVQSEGCDLIKNLRNRQLEGDSKSLENGLSETNEYKLVNIIINVRDCAEDLRKQAEENLKRSKEKESSDNEYLLGFSTKDTERRSFKDIDPEMFSVDSQMPSRWCLRVESYPVEKSTPCPDFKANGNSILCPYDTPQDADCSWLCNKLQDSTNESPRNMSSNPLLSENGDVLQMLDDDIKNQIIGWNTGDVQQMLRIDDDIETSTFGLNTDSTETPLLLIRRHGNLLYIQKFGTNSHHMSICLNGLPMIFKKDPPEGFNPVTFLYRKKDDTLAASCGSSCPDTSPYDINEDGNTECYDINEELVGNPPNDVVEGSPDQDSSTSIENLMITEEFFFAPSMTDPYVNDFCTVFLGGSSPSFPTWSDLDLESSSSSSSHSQV